ncbi:hypothetical protein GCM10025772_28060 [Ferrimonas gelatinilytica]|uniref:Uncharacterized protein n=1 Tax=Ferrimonas gelatinilytica TaxID=1255257 RepID=A0ABP9SEP8_9GAMM
MAAPLPGRAGKVAVADLSRSMAKSDPLQAILNYPVAERLDDKGEALRFGRRLKLGP